MYSTRVFRRAMGVPLGALLALAAACGSATTYHDGAAPRPTRLAPDVGLREIGPRTLSADRGRTLYEVVTTYWPNVLTPPWALRRAPGVQLDQLGVYVNGALAGSLEHFRDVPASRVARVRRLTPNDEYMTFGRQHPAGALVVEYVK
jgi:hypothetical protein